MIQNAWARERPNPAGGVLAAARQVLGALACAYRALTGVIKELDTDIARLCAEANAALLAAPGVGTEVAAALLIAAGEVEWSLGDMTEPTVETADELARLAGRAERSLSALPRPFLRWAGSKQRVLSQVVPRVPRTFDTFYEPFLGAGSLFFLLTPPRAVLSDSNADLIETYRAVRDRPGWVLDYIADMDPMDRAQYYEIRESEFRGRFKRAARFIYLNRAGWNGLYRVNSRGKFNVPYGRPRSPNLVKPEVLHSCSAALRKPGVELEVGDFEVALRTAGGDDLIFLDPPYVTGHNNNGFIDYNEKLFSWADQERLAGLAAGFHRVGAHVLVTNAHHRALLDLYPRFNLDIITRHSTLAGASTSRRKTREVLLWQRPVTGS